jgi:hypothetical protein
LKEKTPFFAFLWSEEQVASLKTVLDTLEYAEKDNSIFVSNSFL